MEIFKRALNDPIAKTSPSIYVAYSRLCYSHNDIDLAKNLLATGIQLAPTDSELLNEIAILKIKASGIEEGMEVGSKSIAEQLAPPSFSFDFGLLPSGMSAADLCAAFSRRPEMLFQFSLSVRRRLFKVATTRQSTNYSFTVGTTA